MKVARLLSPRAAKLAIALECSLSGGRGVVTYETLGQMTGFGSSATISAALRELEAFGIIEVKRKHGVKGWLEGLEINLKPVPETPPPAAIALGRARLARRRKRLEEEERAWEAAGK
ncbi:MAG TPA: hypothetical protein GXX51_06260 [Firmicutes bacterium]|nr:hypothetical protein [Bacillota bacterium]